ncbi:MAG: DUF378 domain-containing protein [Planctomycetota bacterium]|nr:DUF378 domain-containing protein [Planctomycetota bacterium]
MRHLKEVDILAVLLIVVGGLNWGLVGLFGFNLVAFVLGPIPILERIVYVLVGLAALYAAVRSPHLVQLRRETPEAPPSRA